MKKYEFEAVIKKVQGKDASYIDIPFDVEAEFGSKRVKVKATFDNVEYRGSIVKMGLPCYIIGITKEIRKKINKDFGDSIQVTIVEDKEERSIEIPIELQERLNCSSMARNFFESLSFSNKRKYVQWITSAKKEETRVKRIEQAILYLEEGKKI